jgi:shikimate kinase
MEASDAAEHVAEVGESRADERFRSRVALLIAFMAMLLAITSLGGGNVAEDIFNNNIQSSDTWAFYQAKNIRQTSYRLTADTLESELLIHGQGMAPEARAGVEERIRKYRETADRYESEPDKDDPSNPLKGEGKKELSARAKDYAARRDRAQDQDPNFDFAEALFQIAIVLASVAILANSRMIVFVALAVGAAATALMINGYFLLVPLPF